MFNAPVKEYSVSWYGGFSNMLVFVYAGAFV